MKKRALAALALVTVLGVPAAAGTMRVAWDPVPGAAGYKVYWGTSPNNYTTTVDVGNVTQATITTGNCGNYFVAAKAYNAGGESAQYSNEIWGWPKPAVTDPGTINVKQGDQFTITVNGASFQPGGQLQLNTASIPKDANGASLVRISNAAIVNCTRAEALITIDPNAAGSRAMQVGTFPIGFRVTNPDGISGAASPDLRVSYDLFRSDLNRSDAMTRDRVDGKDLAWLAYAHGSGEGDPRWSPDADLNGDGQVDGLDLSLLAAAFGRCWNGSAWSLAACP